ncbi:dimethylamine monooxygenase subunit DmmA family protein [Cryptosporangium sp. NPDC051539]|uniref:dimethylamine monooxygenase subunit DmmA family protein n=1 Tax=Cryptosporangium sp. NPDC051539 TaxID=3363962 RepID=UPI0037A882C9
MIDESGTAYAVVAFGEAGAAAAAKWIERLRELGRPLWAWHGPPGADDGPAALAGQVRGARVGWRLLVAGPEADVLRARAVAIDGGAVPAEVTAVVTDDRWRRVWCPHCGATTPTDGPSVRCSGCGRALVVGHHLSRRRAAYLGSLA